MFIPIWCPGGVICIAVSSPPVARRLELMGREIESCQGVGWLIFYWKNAYIWQSSCRSCQI
jgi:hypothetical protein